MDLIATCARHFERDACAELESLLRACGDGGASAEPSGISGVVLASTGLGPDAAVDALRARLADEPWEFHHVMRVMPVHETVAARAGEIAEAAARLAQRIPEKEAYRITLKRRNTSEGRDAIIGTVAGAIPRRVSLDAPDWVVLVEILGADAGVAVVRPAGILRVQGEKMAASEEDGGALDENVL